MQQSENIRCKTIHICMCVYGHIHIHTFILDSERGRHVHIHVLETQTDSGRIPEKLNRHCLRLGRHLGAGGGSFIDSSPSGTSKGCQYPSCCGCCFTMRMPYSFSSFKTNMNNSFRFQNHNNDSGNLLFTLCQAVRVLRV